MNKLPYIIILIVSLLIFKVPEYNELNNLAIIETIGINYNNNNYTVYLKEIIPKRSDEGISYSYKVYKATSKSINQSINKISNKSNKKFYLKRIKTIITNLKSNKIKEYKIKNIIHTNNVSEKINN